jgi:uncharacterized membrane protein YgcG
MADESTSTSNSVSSNSSVPVVTPTPENAILDQIAQYSSMLAPQMLNWANSVFAQTSQITGEAVNNFFNASQQMTGLAGNMIDQYNNLFAPENAQLVQDANSYASPSRMATDMGMAGATQAQADDAAIKNSEQNLLSFGIDPSSGRYASLDKAAAVQNAANVAGAENLQRMQDINTGQQLRAEAVQTGSMMPAAISNAENTAIQANAGASNASLANANTGAGLMALANQYLQTAMGLKLSPVGQKSSGSSSSNGQSNSNKGSNGGGGSGGGGAGGAGAGGGSGQAWGINNPNYGGAPGISSYNFPGSTNNSDIQTGWGSIGPSDGEGVFGINDPTWLGGSGITDMNPFSDPGFGQTFDFSGTGQGWGDVFGGTSNDSSGALINDGGNSWASGGMGNNTYSPPDMSGFQWPDPGTGGGGGTTDSGGGGGSTDSGGGGGDMDYSDFATGGSVMMTQGGKATPALYDPNDAGGGATTGGAVDPSMSPSGGAQTDDVNAHLNANEFVVPKDVSMWKGQEFFHKLIAQSRTARAQAAATSPVGPQRQPARPGAARFSSHQMR